MSELKLLLNIINSLIDNLLNNYLILATKIDLTTQRIISMKAGEIIQK